MDSHSIFITFYYITYSARVIIVSRSTDRLILLTDPQCILILQAFQLNYLRGNKHIQTSKATDYNINQVE